MLASVPPVVTLTVTTGTDTATMSMTKWLG
jgi:hypothetical protein